MSRRPQDPTGSWQVCGGGGAGLRSARRGRGSFASRWLAAAMAKKSKAEKKAEKAAEQERLEAERWHFY